MQPKLKDTSTTVPSGEVTSPTQSQPPQPTPILVQTPDVKIDYELLAKKFAEALAPLVKPPVTEKPAEKLSIPTETKKRVEIDKKTYSVPCPDCESKYIHLPKDYVVCTDCETSFDPKAEVCPTCSGTRARKPHVRKSTKKIVT